jgi:uncharacterized membrane protein YkvI
MIFVYILLTVVFFFLCRIVTVLSFSWTLREFQHSLQYLSFPEWHSDYEVQCASPFQLIDLASEPFALAAKAV